MNVREPAVGGFGGVEIRKESEFQAALNRPTSAQPKNISAAVLTKKERALYSASLESATGFGGGKRESAVFGSFRKVLTGQKKAL
jgi:hypothetical protein